MDKLKRNDYIAQSARTLYPLYMSWKYSQSTGQVHNPAGQLVCTGYAGQREGLNNPEKQDVHNVGPLPRGLYKMVAWHQNHPHVGMCAIELTPDPNTQMFGRSAFLIHGLSTTDPLHSSEGCPLIGNCTIRLNMWMSQDHDFEVVR